LEENIKNQIEKEIEAAIESELSQSEPEEMILLTGPMCSACDEVKELLKEELESGVIKELDVKEEEGDRLANLLNIDSIPALVTRHGNRYTVSYAKYEGDDLVFESVAEVELREEKKEEGKMAEESQNPEENLQNLVKKNSE